MLTFLQNHAITAASMALVSLILLLAAVPVLWWVVVRLRPDYFCSRQRHGTAWRPAHPLVRFLVMVLKNLAGLLLFCAGVAMLFTPGQGVLTILAGLVLMDYPGKYRFERWLVTRRPVWRAVGWMRRRARAEPLVWPGTERESETAGEKDPPDATQRTE